MLNQRIDMAAPAGMNVSRRDFLLGAAATATGLAVGFRPLTAAAGSAPGGPFEAYLEISEDGVVKVTSSQFEMGQGAWHGIATLVAEELDVPLAQVEVVGGFGDAKRFGNVAWGGAVQGTGGSTSMVTSWDRYREAAAAARAMTVAAAAAAWGAPSDAVTIEGGMVKGPAGKSAGIGAFAKAAAEQTPPTDVRLKDPKDWRLIGSDAPRRSDSRSKTTGAQDYTIDIHLPGQLTAVMIHPPEFGATLASFDAAAARKSPGVVDVVAISRGVAVVAKDMWSALKARDLVEVSWDKSAADLRSSADVISAYRDIAGKAPAAMAHAKGDASGALAGAAKTIAATFEFPFLAHAAMEPLNAVARRAEDGTIEVWGGHQIPDLYQFMASKIAGVEPSKVRLHVMKTGGGFGRRATPDGDVIVEAVEIAKALDWQAPVKVQWTREEDMRGGRYRPAYVHKVEAGLDADGKVVAWRNHIVGQSIVKGTPFEGLIQNGIDKTMVEGASDFPYAVPNIAVGATMTDVGATPLWWRSVGHTHTAYTTEVFIDRLAEAAGEDPVAYRLALLGDHPREAAVLRLAAEKAGWSEGAPAGRAYGVALHKSFSTYVAQVAEVSMQDGAPRVHRVVAAVDIGVAINPDAVRAQIEGGIAFGLGSVLQEELTLTDGQVDQTNYDAYLPLRMDQMPKVEVHIVESSERPTGVGEPGVPPIGPAVANAVRRLTGQSVETLPFARGLGA